MTDFIPIIEFPNYSISKEGLIKNPYGKILKTQIVEGYKALMIKKTRVTIHRLLGLHFIPNPDGKPVIDHIDRNKLNNNLENLRWVTYQENRQNCDNYDNRMTPDEEREYKRNWTANMRANMSPEEKEDYNAHRRETRPEQNEEQKASARIKAKEQRDSIKADPEKALAAKEYKKLKAREYRLAKKTVDTI